ncbi:E3 SUMO-protein ligase NSE2-like [Chironomus tepperi]|uniref:E3 SUMO-protein ligase NSE2-like n=1 Tax=Chironomus tepperi TaxID=113505 RepID=UPI00391F584A
MYSFIHAIQKLEKSYLNAFKLGASDGNIETFNDPAKKDEFKAQFLKLCEIEQSANEEIAMIRNFQCNSVDNFDNEFKKELSELKKKAINPEELAKYKKFVEDIDKIVVVDAPEDQVASNVTMIDADMMVEETQLYIDPISKQKIQDPVKNTICGHIYEKKTILEAIKMNKRMRCAYMGCSNRQHVAAEHLVEDYQLKAKLAKLITQRQNEMDEDDDD